MGGRLRRYPGRVLDAFTSVFEDSRLRALYVVYFLTFLLGDVYRQAVPLYFEALGISAIALGGAWSVVNAVEAVASPVTGVLADRHDRYALGGVAGIATAGFLLAFAFAGDALALVALMSGVGLAQSLLGNAATPAVNAALEEGKEGIGWGIRDVSIYLGAAVGLLLGSVVTARFSAVVYVFPAVAPFALLATALLWRVERPTIGFEGRDRPSLSVRSRLSLRSLAVSLLSLRSLVPSPGDAIAPFRELSSPWLLARICAVKGLASLGMGMGMYFLPLLATEVVVSPEAYLFAFSVSHVAAIPFSILGGLAADRYARKWLFVGNYAVETAMLAAFALTTDLVFLSVGLALFVAQTAFEPAVVSYFFDQFDDEEGGRAWGVSGLVSKVTGVAAPAVGGVLYAIDPHVAFATGAGLTAGGTLLAVTLPR